MRRLQANKLVKKTSQINSVCDIEIDHSPIPEYDYNIDMDNSKMIEKYVKKIESYVRTSYEYKKMVNFLKEDCNMNECAVFENVKNIKDPDKPFNKGPRIEIHHEPFSLFDIVLIVLTKRCARGEDIRPLAVSEEVLYLHAKGVVGLIPLSLTIHNLVHNSHLFIGMDFVAGRPDLFFHFYNKFMTAELKNLYMSNLARKEKISNEVYKELEVLQPQYITIKNSDNLLDSDNL